jgi:Arc/MetJ-type ribon-helix-helix transcriptional regulator
MGTRESKVKVVIEVPDSLVEQIRLAVESGEYDDAREFVTTAVENQLESEEASQQEAQTLEEAIATVAEDQSREIAVENNIEDSSDNDSGQKPQVDAQKEERESNSTDTPIGRRQYDEIETVSQPNTAQLDEGPLWGQYNRLFPVKLVVRCLANELERIKDERAESSQWINLPQFDNYIADIARTVGKKVASHDERQGRKRGEKLAAGLPTGEDAEKSMDRFQTHFVGRAEHGGNLTGAPPHLLLVNMQQEDGGTIGLTEAGREFASLENPLLDGGFDASNSLSRAERRFYVSHVRDVRPEEHEAMEKVAQAIEEGDDRPTSLTERVAYLNPNWSNSQAKTIRSGLTSRMYELGLVDRRRVGQRGTAYELTAEGDAFLNKGAAFATDN